LAKATKHLRGYTNSSFFVCKSIVCLLLPVSAVLIYAGALLLIQASLQRDISLASRRIVTSQALEAKTILLTTQLQLISGSTHELTKLDGSDADVLRQDIARQAVEIADSTRIIEQVASMLALGGNANTHTLLFSNTEIAEALFDTPAGRISVDPIRESGYGKAESAIFE